MNEHSNCKSCGTALQGPYCHVCGEKRLTAEDKSVKRWLGELLSGIWMLDGKLLQTIKYLIFKPGKLSADFVGGRRKPYVKLLNIFLIANILYFLSPSFEIFTTSLEMHRFRSPYQHVVEYAVDLKMEKTGQDFEQLRMQYNQKTVEVSKLILIVLAPLLGLIIYSLFKKQGIYLADGFILALQFWAFFMLVFILFIPYTDRLINLVFGVRFFTGEAFISISALVFSGLYLYFQLRPWKGSKPLVYFVKLVVLAIAFFPVLTVYRFILFWATYWAL